MVSRLPPRNVQDAAASFFRQRHNPNRPGGRARGCSSNSDERNGWLLQHHTGPACTHPQLDWLHSGHPTTLTAELGHRTYPLGQGGAGGARARGTSRSRSYGYPESDTAGDPIRRPLPPAHPGAAPCWRNCSVTRLRTVTPGREHPRRSVLASLSDPDPVVDGP